MSTRKLYPESQEKRTERFRLRRRLAKVAEFCSANPAFREKTIRKYILNGNRNGLFAAGAVVKVCGSIMIDVDRFGEWIESQSEKMIEKNAPRVPAAAGRL